MQKKLYSEERFPNDRDCKDILSFTKQRAFFHTTIIIKSTIWFSISMKFAYQTKTKQYNDQPHLMCVEHGFVVNKTHTSIKKTVHKKFDLKV